MFNEVKKSLSNILEERISSPFYGSLAISWILWNWRAIYGTVFVGQEYIKPRTKIEYLYSLYDNGWIVNSIYLVIAPVASAIILIIYVPKLTNALFKISLRYEKERMDLREDQTASQRLTIAQSASIRNEVSEQAKKYNELISQKDTDLATAKEQANQLLNQKMQFNFQYAEYGTAENFIDVTRIVQAQLFGNKKLVVNNDTFANDPIPGKYKRILIVYSFKGETKAVTAREHEEIHLDESNEIKVTSTDLSKSTYQNLIDSEVLSSIEKLFPGTWKLNYEGDITGEEEVQIHNKDQYFLKTGDMSEFVHYFNLEHIQVNLEQNKIGFNKRAINSNDNRNVHCDLEIVEIGKQYIGTENEGRIRVNYQRIK